MCKELINTAYHEAGHAVFSVLLSVPFKYVTIVYSEGLFGHLRYLLPKSRMIESIDAEVTNRLRDYIERRIMVALAGGLAAEKFEDNWENAVGIELDYMQAIDLSAYVTSSIEETEAYVNWLSIRSGSLLDVPAHWSMVQAVADSLLVHSRLSASEVKAIAAKY